MMILAMRTSLVNDEIAQSFAIIAKQVQVCNIRCALSNYVKNKRKDGIVWLRQICPELHYAYETVARSLLISANFCSMTRWSRVLYTEIVLHCISLLYDNQRAQYFQWSGAVIYSLFCCRLTYQTNTNNLLVGNETFSVHAVSVATCWLEIDDEKNKLVQSWRFVDKLADDFTDTLIIDMEIRENGLIQTKSYNALDQILSVQKRCVYKIYSCLKNYIIAKLCV